MFCRAVASSLSLLVKPSVVTLFRAMLKAVYKHIISINKRVLLSSTILQQHYSSVQPYFIQCYYESFFFNFQMYFHST